MGKYKLIACAVTLAAGGALGGTSFWAGQKDEDKGSAFFKTAMSFTIISAILLCVGVTAVFIMPAQL